MDALSFLWTPFGGTPSQPHGHRRAATSATPSPTQSGSPSQAGTTTSPVGAHLTPAAKSPAGHGVLREPPKTTASTSPPPDAAREIDSTGQAPSPRRLPVPTDCSSRQVEAYEKHAQPATVSTSEAAAFWAKVTAANGMEMQEREHGKLDSARTQQAEEAAESMAHTPMMDRSDQSASCLRENQDTPPLIEREREYPDLSSDTVGGSDWDQQHFVHPCPEQMQAIQDAAAQATQQYFFVSPVQMNIMDAIHEEDDDDHDSSHRFHGQREPASMDAHTVSENKSPCVHALAGDLRMTRVTAV